MWQYDSEAHSIFIRYDSDTTKRFAYTGEFLRSYRYGFCSEALSVLPNLTRLIVLVEGIKLPC